MKHKKTKSYSRKAIIINLALFTLLLMGVGYSLLSTDLNLFGSVQLKKYDHTLYGVFEKEKSKSSLVQEYTGSHQDSFTQTGNQKIYYWYAGSDSDVNILSNKDNVIFGGFCWKMIRTTDTGGVKLLYNGVPSDGKCNTTGAATQIGMSPFNSNSNSPAYAGYMYNTIYSYQMRKVLRETMLYQEPSALTTYWYSDSVTWGSPVANKYNLDNPYQVSGADEYSNLVGTYTFLNTSQSYTGLSVNYIVAVNNGRLYYFRLENEAGSMHTLDYYNHSYTYGDSYTDNGDGTYTINNPITIHISDWYTSFNDVGKNKYVCKNANNNTCSDLWYTTSSSALALSYISVNSAYKYANSFTYNQNTGAYELDTDSVSFVNYISSTDQDSLNTHHYTCWNESGECTTLSYIFLIGTDNTIYYINLTNGRSIEDALNEMLYNDDVNQIDSTIKIYIDDWYQSNMIQYTSYLEDTVFCNDRSQSNYSTNGWNPDGGSIKTRINFKGYDQNSLKCSNEVDQFSLFNNKAKLDYPVGLASRAEMNLSSYNYKSIIMSGNSYWLGSPLSYENFTNVYSVLADGGYAGSNVAVSFGVRPVVSLKPGTQYASGDGSKNNPYIVETN